MKKSGYSPGYLSVCCFIILFSFAATNVSADAVFDINGDKKTGVQEAVYALNAAANGYDGPTIDKYSLWTGENTTLRGANIWQGRSYNGTYYEVGDLPVGPAYTQSDFDQLAAMGANYVNISHPGLYTESAPFQVDTDIQSNLDNLLDMIQKADMFAVICFRTGPGRSEFTFVREEAGDWFTAEQLDESVWTDQAKQDAWAEMWRYTANRYKDNPVVAGYDLMVEPNANELLEGVLEDAFDPDAFYQQYADTLYDWNLFYPRLVDAVREADADTPVLVGGMSYSAVSWLPYLKKSSASRIVYAVHHYEPYAQYTHQSPDGTNSYPGTYDVDYDDVADTFDKNWLDSLFAIADGFVSQGEAVAVNEFGVIRWVPDAAAYMKDVFDLFEQRGWNHALWQWYPEHLVIEWDDFNFMNGSDSTNHVRVTSSELIETIQNNWSKNTARPSSNTVFDINGDGKTGLEEAVYALKIVAGR